MPPSRRCARWVGAKFGLYFGSNKYWISRAILKSSRYIPEPKLILRVNKLSGESGCEVGIIVYKVLVRFLGWQIRVGGGGYWEKVKGICVYLHNQVKCLWLPLFCFFLLCFCVPVQFPFNRYVFVVLVITPLFFSFLKIFSCESILLTCIHMSGRKITFLSPIAAVVRRQAGAIVAGEAVGVYIEKGILSAIVSEPARAQLHHCPQNVVLDGQAGVGSDGVLCCACRASVVGEGNRGVGVRQLQSRQGEHDNAASLSRTSGPHACMIDASLMPCATNQGNPVHIPVVVPSVIQYCK